MNFNFVGINGLIKFYLKINYTIFCGWIKKVKKIKNKKIKDKKELITSQFQPKDLTSFYFYWLSFVFWGLYIQHILVYQDCILICINCN